MQRRNAIIMAAGTSSRFVPLSSEKPKGLIVVKNEVLLERQIRQLKETDVNDITLVVGYKAEMFHYLREKMGVNIVKNNDYARYNNISSLIRVIDRLDNTYICCSDNYFTNNVFEEEPTKSYYSALFSQGETTEYCITTDNEDCISNITIGGRNCWYMIGHAFFNSEFSKAFRKIMIEEYKNEDTKHGYWEDIYIKHIHSLPKMEIHRYGEDDIFEFDTIDELRLFDSSYIDDTRSIIIKGICKQLKCQESELNNFKRISSDHKGLKFSFNKGLQSFIYDEDSCNIICSQGT